MRTDALACIARGVCAWMLMLVVLPAAAAAPGNALERYVSDLRTGSADFRQIVVDPGGRMVGDGTGRLVIVRPGKFRWESSPAGAPSGAQLLIADGRNLWFLDRDLDQATVKPLDDALPQSPAMLLAGGADIAAAFEQRSLGRRDGFEWIEVRPRDARSDFREARFAFQSGQLSRLVVLDKLGQRSELRFTAVKKNAPVDPELLRFELPAGVYLIGTPQAATSPVR